MQNLLLGDLFEHRVNARVPADPKYIVVTLDRHEELTRYFNDQTRAGRETKRHEDRARAEAAARSSPRSEQD